MTPDQFILAGQRLHGKKFWKARLARDLGVNPATIHRLVKREQIPGPYEIAVKAMLDNKRQRDKLEKEARKLLPRKFRKRSPRAAANRKIALVAKRDREGRPANLPQPGADRPDEAGDVARPVDGVARPAGEPVET